MIFRTDDVRPADRFAYWSDAVCASYTKLCCDTENRQTFAGGIRLNKIANVGSSKVWGSGQVVERRPCDIAQYDDESVLLSFQVQNQCEIRQNGRSAVIEPGEFAAYRSSDPYRLRLDDNFRQHVIQVPHRALSNRLPNLDQLTARRIRKDVGEAIYFSIRKIIALGSSSNEVMRACQEDAIIDLIATGLASLDEGRIKLRESGQNILIHARQHIERTCTQPELTRMDVSDAVGVSVRRLNELFASENSSIQAEIREARLQRICAALADPRQAHRSVADIAFRCGLENAQYFSRQFKARFGQTPTAYRASKGWRVRDGQSKQSRREQM
ncbi:helix-turn-helix domain-containing protein [Tateyamaria omphalii]|uniref:helix-turn-helix domain-containing protein n=1 Tax=Tateyamaria omphalii TaxID=299262 RepID=UPI001C994907|nr:helix-turn-helix domain-containing protein [Tateyamaria omphalii]MBY5935205.1 helix-turn-helix domain-containing protein [Tateyamaria omphalii]